MKIGFFLRDNGLTGIDMRNPENGNPGIGGTEYCFAMVMKELISECKDINVECYHYNNNILPVDCKDYIVKDSMEVITLAELHKLDCLVVSTQQSEEFYSKLEERNIPTVLWAHCFILNNELKCVTKNASIKKVVFVGKEQYDTYVDHDIINKSTYIYNMFYYNDRYNRIENYENNVTYIGSLTKEKGFHILASVWRNVIRKVPDTKLNVIGSGKLYNRNNKVGPYQIADEEYEKKFMKYLVDEDGKIIPSVNFLGIMGQEKVDIINNTSVGVINPSAISETFGISAVEMEACGVPIVTKGKYGLLDTVKRKKTGELFLTKYGFSRKLIKLLKNNELNAEYGTNAQKFVIETFAPEIIVQRWHDLFVRVCNNQQEIYDKPTENFNNNYKWLRIFVRNIRFKLKIKWIPAVVEIKPIIKKIIRK